MAKKWDKSQFNKETLKNLRIANGYSRPRLAFEIDVNHMTVYYWEHPDHIILPSDANLRKLANALGCKIDDFFGEFDLAFREAATETIQEMFFRFSKSNLARDARVAVAIFSHLFPEPHRHDVNLTVNNAEDADADLLDEGDIPACEVP